MIIFAQAQPGLAASNVGGSMRIWYRCQTEDGSHAEDVPVDVTNSSLSEALLDAAVRTAIATRFSAKLGSLILATDIRIR